MVCALQRCSVLGSKKLHVGCCNNLPGLRTPMIGVARVVFCIFFVNSLRRTFYIEKFGYFIQNYCNRYIVHVYK